MAVAVDLRQHVCRQGVDAADADAVQTAGHLVRALVELTTGVQDGHDDLEGRLMHLLVLVDGNTATIVLDGNGVIFVDGYLDMGTETGHGLVDGVIDSLVDQMVESFFTDVANIHGGTLADSFQSLKHLDVTRGVVFLLLLHKFFCHFSFICYLAAKLQKIVHINEVYVQKKHKKTVLHRSEIRLFYAWVQFCFIPAC